MYERDFGFNFASFTPAELFGRIRGAPLAAAWQLPGSLAALRSCAAELSGAVRPPGCTASTEALFQTVA